MGSSSFDIFFFNMASLVHAWALSSHVFFFFFFPFFLSFQIMDWKKSNVCHFFPISLNFVIAPWQGILGLALPLSVSICVRTDILSCMGRCLFAGFHRQVFLSVRYVSRLGLGVSDSIHPMVRSPMFLFFLFFRFLCSLLYWLLQILKKRS